MNEPKPGEGNIPDYKNQPKVNTEKIRKRNFELLEKGFGKKTKPSEEQLVEIIESAPSQEIAPNPKLQPEKPTLDELVNEDFRKPGGKFDMVKYGKALKNAKDTLEGKIKYAPTEEEQKLINKIDDTLAEMEKGVTPKNQAEINEVKIISGLSKAETMSDKEFNKEIDAILEKLEQGEQKGQN